MSDCILKCHERADVDSRCIDCNGHGTIDSKGKTYTVVTAEVACHMLGLPVDLRGWDGIFVAFNPIECTTESYCGGRILYSFARVTYSSARGKWEETGEGHHIVEGANNRLSWAVAG